MENSTNALYGYKKEVQISFLDAVAKTREALALEGFGILMEIDVKATLEKKLHIEHDNYLILGACNPPFAYEALKAEKDIGLLLPCNIIIYEDIGKVYVSAIVPSVAMGMIKNDALTAVASIIEEKLKKVIDAIS